MGKRESSRPKTVVSLEDALGWMERRGTKGKIRELDRYGIVAHDPYGIAVGDLRKYAKGIGIDHELAQALWATQRYEARMLAAFVDDPDRVTLTQMNRWAADFDNWAIVDTVCFHLFDRTPHAWKKVHQWAGAKPEFTKRAGFALLWSLSTHDKEAADAVFREGLERIEPGAQDEREYVKKGVNMALRAVGKRNRPLNQAAIRIAKRLSKSAAAAPRWVGSHALRELESAAVQKRFADH